MFGKLCSMASLNLFGTLGNITPYNSQREKIIKINVNNLEKRWLRSGQRAAAGLVIA